MTFRISQQLLVASDENSAISLAEKDANSSVYSRSSTSLPSATSSALAEPRFLAELKWIVVSVVVLLLILALFSYKKSDPAWSTSGLDGSIQNAIGLLGAWTSDLLLYLFGLSAWWWAVLGCVYVWRAWKRAHGGITLVMPAWARVTGFALILFASCAIEASRLSWLHATLPHAPGGVLGYSTGQNLTNVIGYTGGSLVLIVALLSGFSLFFSFSWLTVAETIGTFIETRINRRRLAQEADQDRAIGESLAEQRFEAVREVFERREEEPPVRIEPQKVLVPRSERVEKEKQQPLFAEIIAGSLPQLGLLDAPTPATEFVARETLEFTSRLIEKKLADFKLEVKVVAAYPGPVITRYEIEPSIGVKGAQIVSLSRDLARSLSLTSIRVVETIPGKTTMGLELPNPKRQTVRLSEILGSQIYNESRSLLTMALGKDIGGNPAVADLAKMPHLLVAGTTGSGKSVGINAMILSLLYKAEANDVRLILIDPKMLEMSVYEDIPHLLAPVVTDMKQAANALNWCVAEMERRYKLMSKMGVRNLAGFNTKIIEAEKIEQRIPNPFSLTPDAPEPLQKLPHIVVVIDELADLMMVIGKKIEELIARLAQKARAAGIHLILATQRPSVDVITGLIKANVPSRIAFQVSSKIDSRTILDQMGAEALLGMGDMLYMPIGQPPIRVHGAFVSDEEVHRVVAYLKEQGEPNYIEGILDGASGGEDGDGVGSVTGFTDAESDPLYDQAVEVVLKNRRASISLVQRHLRIGYNRAARLLEQMEQAGMIGALESNGSRAILAPNRNAE
jgi:S-DNA-T family DNA segregation ATPase FtsK/SpoIIIE